MKDEEPIQSDNNKIKKKIIIISIIISSLVVIAVVVTLAVVLTRKKDDDKDSKDKVEDSTNTEKQIADFDQTCLFLQLLNFIGQEANSFSPRAEAKSN